MKKLITFAALCAAGTACAYAETYTWVGGTEGAETSWGTASNWRLSDGSLATSIPSYTNTNEDTYIIGDGAIVSATNHSVGNLGATLIVGNNVNLSANWAFIFKNVTIGSGFINKLEGDGIKWGTDNSTSTVANSLSLNSEYSYSNRILTSIGTNSSINFGTDGKISLSGNSVSDLGGKSFRISASFTVGTSGTLECTSRILIAGKNIWYRDVTNDNKVVDYTQSSMTSIDGLSVQMYDLAKSADADWVLDGKTVATGDLTAGAYRFYATEADGIGVQYFSYVPEPSAFGLLAGMGALALVASRRRRK